eukprot:TRINITY_DN1263_c0_g1_i2.p1 TRINITY_DN1263_c0_g1~~TRINITY_DN1263_c0_g1_i2.p1  ORF type:complete len:605 (-),score=114.26 TRINITY_DN1263_c0_g1_i2:299-2113(-)
MIEYEEENLAFLLFRNDGFIRVRACLYAIPSMLVAIGLLYLDDYYDWRSFFDMDTIGQSVLWTTTSGVLATLLGFRTRQALARFWEGTSLLHQMRGEWFDTVSNCVTFSIGAKKTKKDEVNRFRHTLVRLMSVCHGSALEEIADNQIKLRVIDVNGLDITTITHIRQCAEVYKFNRVEVLLHLVQSLITQAHTDGILTVPPPILSRAYQTISRGFVNLLNAKKISDTRFPFPYSQLIAFLLFANILFTPILMSQLVKSKVVAAVLTFLPVFGMVSVNFVANQLENPFGVDDNDLPLTRFQSEMNSCLLMLLHDNTDMIADCSESCEFDFDKLVEASTADEDDTDAFGGRLSLIRIPSHRKRPASKLAEINASLRSTDAIEATSSPSIETPAPVVATAEPPKVAPGELDNDMVVTSVTDVSTVSRTVAPEAKGSPRLPSPSSARCVQPDPVPSTVAIEPEVPAFLPLVGKASPSSISQRDGHQIEPEAPAFLPLVGKASPSSISQRDGHQIEPEAPAALPVVNPAFPSSISQIGEQRLSAEPLSTQLLEDTVIEFNETLHRWTSLLESQLGQMASTFDKLHGDMSNMKGVGRFGHKRLERTDCIT